MASSRASRGEKEVDASNLKKVGRRNINRFETGTVKRTESSGGRRPTSKTVTLANPKPGYGKRTDHYKKNKLSAPDLGRHGTSSATEPGPCTILGCTDPSYLEYWNYDSINMTITSPSGTRIKRKPCKACSKTRLTSTKIFQIGIRQKWKTS